MTFFLRFFSSPVFVFCKKLFFAVQNQKKWAPECFWHTNCKNKFKDFSLKKSYYDLISK